MINIMFNETFLALQKRLLFLEMAPQSVFITGCNRGRKCNIAYYKFSRSIEIAQLHLIPITGIGLELVKQFLALPTPPRNIFATYRSKERSGRKTFLENLKKQMIFVGELLELAGTTPALQPLQLDVTDTSSYPGIVDQVIPSNNI